MSTAARTGRAPASIEATPDRVFRPNHRLGQDVRKNGLFWWRQPFIEVFNWRRQTAGVTAAQVDDGLLQRRGQSLCLSIGLGRNHIDAQHDVGVCELSRWAEPAAIQLNRLHHELRGKV